MSTTWRARTMRDELAAQTAPTGLQPTGSEGIALVGAMTGTTVSSDVIAAHRARCVCGRTVNAELLLDVRALPASVRLKGADYICDACIERLIVTGRIAREDVYRLLGAPSAIVDRMRAMALVCDPIRRIRPVIPLPTK